MNKRITELEYKYLLLDYLLNHDSQIMTTLQAKNVPITNFIEDGHIWVE